MLIVIAMLLFCDESERIEISARLSRLPAAALTFSHLPQEGVRLPWSVPHSNMNTVPVHRMRHAVC